MQIDVALKMLGGVDIMTMPALQEWLTAVISGQIARAMTYPNLINLSFRSNDVRMHANAAQWPQGLATATIEHVRPVLFVGTRPAAGTPCCLQQTDALVALLEN